MRWYTHLPIRRKLTLLMVLASTVAVVLAGAGWFTYDLAHSRRMLVRDLTIQAEIVGANCGAALAFQDAPAAQEVLSRLSLRPVIRRACVLTPDGRLFASYPADRVRPLPLPLPADHRFEGTDLLVCRPIQLGQDMMGSIYLEADLSEQWARLPNYAIIALGVMAASLVVALLVSARLQRFASEPVLDLARVARRVTAEKDYSLRAAKYGQDEIGTLVDDFNAMLTRVQERDEALRASEQRFRQLAETISEVFWLSDPDKAEMLYVSPAYERVWGRSCASLRAHPLSWLDAIHPDDQGRVQQAAFTRQVLGTYDEEYRILRPDGSLRWIRDRAFPIRDASGTVYRIAGLAEDITERKALEEQLLEVSEREQRRIGQDLHDGLCQHLLGTALATKVLEQALAAQQLPQTSQAVQIGKLIDQAITQARTLARGLSPVQLDAHGLTTALHELALNVEQTCAVACQFVSRHPLLIEDNAAATHLYRIAQEAVANAIRHGQAHQITLRLEALNGGGRLTVTDDGTGIADDAGTRGGMGLHIMAYRAAMLGGTLDVNRLPQGGTAVVCTFKLPVPANDDGPSRPAA